MRNLIVAAVVGAVLALAIIASVANRPGLEHRVGADQSVCMEIRAEPRLVACASGAEVIEWLRHREENHAATEAR